MLKQKIELSHQAELEPKLRQMAGKLSEYCFANIYLFRHVHDYELVTNGESFITGKTYDGARFLMPVTMSGLEELASRRSLPEGIDFIYPIEEQQRTLFDSSRWQSNYKEEDSDYLFDVKMMATFPGRHLSKKRNLVKQFIESYKAEIQPLTKQNSPLANQVIERWSHTSREDIKECKEAIELIDTLKLVGTLYLVGNEPAGFIIGEALSEKSFVVHFAKADIQYKGIYQFMYQSFAQMTLGLFPFLNMEQDLGLAELRQAKHSYQPLQLCNKYRLFI